MKNKLGAFLICTLFTVSGTLLSNRASGFAVASVRQQQQNISVTTNEGSAIRSLRALLLAETTYQNTNGKGEFGSLKELHDANLIDNVLARGVKNGFRFTIMTKKSTLTTHPAFDLVARPVEYGKHDRRSFYLTESNVMLTSDEKDAPLASMKPFATSGGEVKASEQEAQKEPADETEAEELAGKVSAYEASVAATLRAIHAAEAKYIAKAGAGAYGTLDQLERAGLVDKGQIAAAQRGYSFDVKIGAAKSDSAATYSISANPLTYGVSGRNSFFIDQTGVLRAADNEGGPADATVPPLN